MIWTLFSKVSLFAICFLLKNITYLVPLLLLTVIFDIPQAFPHPLVESSHTAMCSFKQLFLRTEAANREFYLKKLFLKVLQHIQYLVRPISVFPPLSSSSIQVKTSATFFKCLRMSIKKNLRRPVFKFHRAQAKKESITDLSNLAIQWDVSWSLLKLERVKFWLGLTPAALFLKKPGKGGIHSSTWMWPCFRAGLYLCMAILTELNSKENLTELILSFAWQAWLQ